jgi:hypothetical protein
MTSKAQAPWNELVGPTCEKTNIAGQMVNLQTCIASTSLYNCWKKSCMITDLSNPVNNKIYHYHHYHYLVEWAIAMYGMHESLQVVPDP